MHGDEPVLLHAPWPTRLLVGVLRLCDNIRLYRKK
jgi:hypothetical protein